MSVQLEKLAVLDIASGEQVFSIENKTRQVYNAKPLTVQIEGNQKVTEAYEYSVALSGLLSKEDKALLSKLAKNHSKVMLSGYTAFGLFLQGTAETYQDDSAFVFKTTGIGTEGVSLGALSLDEKIYFPFVGQSLTFSATFKSDTQVSFLMLDGDMDPLHEDEPVSFHVPKFCGKMAHSFSMTTPDNISYIHIVMHHGGAFHDGKLTLG